MEKRMFLEVRDVLFLLEKYLILGKDYMDIKKILYR